MTATRTSPAEVAREVFRQLAQLRKPPTPDNYARAYARQAGIPLAEVQPAAAAMEALARSLLADAPRSEHAQALREALEAGQWGDVQKILRVQLSRATVPPATAPPPGALPPPASARPPELAAVRTGSDAVAGTAAHRDAVRALKELLAKTIDFLVDERLGYTAEVVREVQLLVEGARNAITTAEIDEAANRLRHFWLRLELRGEGPEPMIRGLHELVRLMVRNMGDLVVDDQWVKGQCDRIRSLLDAPLSPKALQDAQRGYREFVFRQGTLKHAMDEAASAIRELTAAVIERLGAASASTGRLSETIARYSEQIRAADGLPQVRDTLARLLDETRCVHVEMIATHEALTESREKVRHYEARVRALQAELVQMSETVIEDPLTAALNRRGLEQRFVAEQARAERTGSPICIAVLDVDNFKQLNDRLGHGAGDEALKHLAAVVRDTLRASDSLARYGGEEFVILLPDTGVEEAERVMVRVQRELTKRFFMHNHERVLITFSAGVALRRPGEAQESVIERADRAMYEAKQAGKNRVRRADGGDA